MSLLPRWPAAGSSEAVPAAAEAETLPAAAPAADSCDTPLAVLLAAPARQDSSDYPPLPSTLRRASETTAAPAEEPDTHAPAAEAPADAPAAPAGAAETQAQVVSLQGSEC